MQKNSDNQELSKKYFKVKGMTCHQCESKVTRALNRIPEILENMSYPILFIVGVLTSFHCIGMCGGINLSQTSSTSIEEKKFPVFKRGLQYNIGRLISYTILGGIVGGIGSAFSLSLMIQGIIIITAGLIMIILELNMMGLFSSLRRLVPVIPASAAAKIAKLSGKRNPFVIGLLNGFMPCGPLQSMQIYALSTGSIIKGALSMFLLSAGTIPFMLGFGTLSLLFSKKFQKNLLKISALLIILLGGGMINRGLSINGISMNISNEVEIKTNAAVAEIKGDIQIVISDVSPSGYEPIIVQAGIPVQWYLDAGPGDITGCNKAIIVRDFGIQQDLSVGKTLVEFTAEKTGNYSFTCWMGMINSNILVVHDLESFDPELLNTHSESTNQRVEIQIPDFKTEDIKYSSLVNDTQRSELLIDENGFTPAIIVMQREIMTQWEFIPSSINETNSRIVFPSYNAQIDLEETVQQTIEISVTEDFYFHSWLGDFLGFEIVVDDIYDTNDEMILEAVYSYLKQ